MKILLVLTVAAIFVLAACAPEPNPTPSPTPGAIRMEAACIRVIDGDTIEVLIDGDKYKVLFTNMLTGQPIETDIPEFLKQCLKNMENLLQELRPTLPQESAGDV